MICLIRYGLSVTGFFVQLLRLKDPKYRHDATETRIEQLNLVHCFGNCQILAEADE